MGVLRGEEKKHIKLKSSSNGEPTDQEAETRATGILSHRQQEEVAGSLDKIQSNSHNPSDSVNGDSVTEMPEGNGPSEGSVNSGFRLLASNSSELGLWRQAWDDVLGELEKMLPSDFQSIEELDTLGQVREVHKEAQRRAQDAHMHERKITGTKKTYRELYGKVANCANKFQIVGDMVTQSEPVYAALPWALIRFVIQCAVGTYFRGDFFPILVFLRG